MHFDKLIEEKLSGLSKGKSVKDIAKIHNTTLAKIKSQLVKGVKVEKEHGGTKKDIKATAMDHLVEDPKYYTKLKKAKI